MRHNLHAIMTGLICLSLILSGCSTRPSSLLQPNGVVAALDGTLYVMDRGNYRIAHLSADGALLGSFGGFGTDQQQIYYGWDIALDQAGNIYFADTVSDDEGTRHEGIKVFSSQGRFLREIGAVDYPIGSSETSNQDYGIDIDNQDRLYVADYGPSAVRIFDAQGNLLRRIVYYGEGAEVEIIGLQDLAVDDGRQLLYITDFRKNHVEQFQIGLDANGVITLTHTLTIGSYGHGLGELAYPQFIAVNDQNGLVYVGDLANRRIQVFDHLGQALLEFAPPDVADWQVMGLNLDQAGNIYAADALHNVIWVFSPDGTLIRQIEATR